MENIATSMKDKKTLVRKAAFPSPPKNSLRKPRIPASTAYLRITKEQVYNALMAQSTKKAPGPDKINFEILRMIWKWEDEQMTGIVKHAIRLGYYPKEWKRARGNLLEKGGKRDLTLVKSYRVIGLLNCMSKVLEKVIAEQLSQLSKSFLKLHPGQMGTRKERCAIDAVASLVHEVQ